MTKFAIIMLAAILIGAGLVTWISDANWQTGLILLIMGIFAVIFFFKG
jgi:hypothetical protein